MAAVATGRVARDMILYEVIDLLMDDENATFELMHYALALVIRSTVPKISGYMEEIVNAYSEEQLRRYFR